MNAAGPDRTSIPIITFTANLVAETTYYVDDWDAGKTSRAAEERFQVGGKGINVSKMLRRLGAETTAMCYPGGLFGGSVQDWLDRHSIPFAAFPDGCVTRSGSIVRSPDKPELSILGLDSQFSTEAVQSCGNFLEKSDHPFTLAICGVIPGWTGDQWQPFRDWIPQRGENVTLALDTYGDGLDWLVSQNPDLVKINRDELEMLVEPDQRALDTPVLLEQVASQYNCPQWIITNGEKAIWSKRRNESALSIQPKQVDCVSPVGCGDVFFATLLDGLYNRSEEPQGETLKRAAEYASRNAESHGIADFELD